MLELYRTKRFKKMLKKYKGKKNVLAELEYIVELLLTEQDIPAKYRDHALTGNYQGIRELPLSAMEGQRPRRIVPGRRG